MGPCRIAFSFPLFAGSFTYGRVAFVSARVTVLGLDRAGNEGQGLHAALELFVDSLQAGDLCLERGGEQVEGEPTADGLKGRSFGL